MDIHGSGEISVMSFTAADNEALGNGYEESVLLLEEADMIYAQALARKALLQATPLSREGGFNARRYRQDHRIHTNEHLDEIIRTLTPEVTLVIPDSV